MNAFLCSRLDTSHETDEDESVNVYMAQLLYALVDGSLFGQSVDLLSTNASDVHCKVEERDSDRHKLQVYRANADYRLVAFGLFAGFASRRSLASEILISNDAYLEEAQQYYGWAALYGNRMPKKYRGLSQTLSRIALNFTMCQEILGYMGIRYFNLCRRLSPGELFHLEKQAHEDALPYIETRALDHLLDSYNSWRDNPSEESRKRLQEACGSYEKLNPDFDAGQLRLDAVATRA